MRALSLYLALAALFLSSCNQEPKTATPPPTPLPNIPVEADAPAVESVTGSVIGKAYPLDSLKNPFVAAPDTGRVKACGDTARAAVLGCVVGQFRAARFPIEVGPGQEPQPYTPFFFDSLFVLKCLQDTSYFKDEPADRTYGYHKGRVLARTSRYVLCLIPFGFSVGQQYFLCSFAPDGHLIDKKILGAQEGDFSETYGLMPDARHFTTRYIEFGEQEGQISKRLTQHYVIDDGGRFGQQ